MLYFGFQNSTKTKAMIPVIFPTDIIPLLNRIKTERKNFVVKNNEFLFARSQGSMDHRGGWESVKAVIEYAGKERFERPDLLTPTFNRHHVSNMFIIMADVTDTKVLMFNI